MFAKERLEEIAGTIEKEQRVTVKELAEKYQVTEDSIRKDLTVLEKQGRLQKVYGGAVSVRRNPGLYSSSQRINDHEEERQELAEQMFSLLKPGMTVFLDVSVTNILLAEKIRDSGMELTAVTNMIAVMNVLATAERVKLILLGGRINKERDAFWSSAAAEAAGRYRYDLAFLGTVGVNSKTGELSTYQEEDGILKHIVIERAKQSWIIAEEHKFQEEGDYRYGDLDEVSGLILSRKAARTCKAKSSGQTRSAGRKRHE